MEYIKEIDIEIDRKCISEIVAVQSDSARAILFSLYQQGSRLDLTGKIIRAWGEKPDKTKIYADLAVVDAPKGQCKLNLTNNMLACAGKLKLMLAITEEEKILSTTTIIVTIEKSLKDNEAIESRDEFTALENDLKTVQKWNEYFTETSGKIEEKYTDRLNKKVDSKYVKIYPITAEEINSLILTGLNQSIMNLTYEYGHINRYGAKELGKDEFDALYNKTATDQNLNDWDSSKAIQTAVYVVEKLATNRKGIYPVKFGGGTYLVTHTIICKSCINNSPEVGNANNPLSFIGVERKTINSSWSSGTLIIPWIKNTNFIAGSTTEGYANLFAINVKYQSKNEYIAPASDNENEIGKPYKDLSDTDLYDTNYSFYGTGVNKTICNNVTFKNLSFYIDTNVADNYNINVIKAYRTRFTIDNIFVHNMRQFMLQPPIDATGGSSYCDFSQYTNINFSRLKYRGLELYNADNSKIEDITNHFPGKDFDSLILIRGGGGITISRVHFAFSFDLDINKEQHILVPKQLGTGQNGTKAYIKLVNTRGVSVNGVYGERQLLDYLFYLYYAKNVHIENTTEAFFGNGYMYIAGDSSNISINNAYRKSNLVSDYVDIYFGNGVDVNNIKISNFIGENWYEENISLATKQDDFANLTQVGSTTKRHITSNKLNNTKANKFSLEPMTFKILTVNGKLAILDYANNSTNDSTSTETSAKNDYFSVNWDTNNMGGFIIEPTKDIPFCIRSVTPVYSTVGSVYLPISSTNASKYRIAMWDIINNKYITAFNANLGCIVNVEILRM